MREQLLKLCPDGRPLYEKVTSRLQRYNSPTEVGHWCKITIDISFGLYLSHLKDLYTVFHLIKVCTYKKILHYQPLPLLHTVLDYYWRNVTVVSPLYCQAHALHRCLFLRVINRSLDDAELGLQLSCQMALFTS